jgi:hypothetical protein
MKKFPATVLYGERHATVDATESPDADRSLWIDTTDLPRVNGFELKPHGACRDELCVPIPNGMRRGDSFNLTAFAALVGQTVVAEPGAHVWSFGEIDALGSGTSRMAPDFEVPDRLGRPVRLAGFRGKKVLVVTWASW